MRCCVLGVLRIVDEGIAKCLRSASSKYCAMRRDTSLGLSVEFSIESVIDKTMFD